MANPRFFVQTLDNLPDEMRLSPASDDQTQRNADQSIQNERRQTTNEETSEDPMPSNRSGHYCLHDGHSGEKLAWQAEGPHAVAFRSMEDNRPRDKDSDKVLEVGPKGPNVVNRSRIYNHWPHDRVSGKELEWGTEGPNVVNCSWIYRHWPHDRVSGKELEWGTEGPNVVNRSWIKHHWPHDRVSGKKLEWGSSGDNVFPSYKQRALRSKLRYSCDVFDAAGNVIHQKGDAPPKGSRIRQWGAGTNYELVDIDSNKKRKKARGSSNTLAESDLENQLDALLDDSHDTTFDFFALSENDHLPKGSRISKRGAGTHDDLVDIDSNKKRKQAGGSSNTLAESDLDNQLDALLDDSHDATFDLLALSENDHLPKGSRISKRGAGTHDELVDIDSNKKIKQARGSSNNLAESDLENQLDALVDDSHDVTFDLLVLSQIHHFPNPHLFFGHADLSQEGAAAEEIPLQRIFDT
jgi:hypothetical protein